MIVVARNNGPFYEEFNGNRRRGLIEGKTYDVVEWAAHNGTKWITQSGDFINPKEPMFFVKVLNEDGILHDYWNDYFLSSKEMRDIKIDNILQ